MDTKKKILLVEDDTALAGVYRSRLELEGFDVKEVNNGRLRDAIRNRTAVYQDGRASLSAPSYDATALAADPSLEVSYLVAPPRMAYYEKVSRQIYGIYLKYIAPEDIVVYSIDEVFIDATAYLGSRGRAMLDAKVRYDVLLSNRLVLQPLVETTISLKNEPEHGIGSGLGKIEAGLRLRYEFTRQFAPYIGIAHERALGNTADIARTHGGHLSDTRVVAGVRFWF